MDGTRASIIDIACFPHRLKTNQDRVLPSVTELHIEVSKGGVSNSGEGGVSDIFRRGTVSDSGEQGSGTKDTVL